MRRPLDSEERKSLEKIASGMEGLREALLTGIAAVGGLLSSEATHEAGLSEKNTFGAGWLLEQCSQLIQATNFIEGEIEARLTEAEESPQGKEVRALLRASELQDDPKPQEKAATAQEPGQAPSLADPEVAELINNLWTGALEASKQIGFVVAHSKGLLPKHYIDGEDFVEDFAEDGYKAIGRRPHARDP